jgi:hypothetical protein
MYIEAQEHSAIARTTAETITVFFFIFSPYCFFWFSYYSNLSLLLFLCGKRKKESAAFSPAFRLHPDAPLVAPDYFIAYGQAYACAVILIFCVQPLENLEYPFAVLRVNADPVVLY